MGLKNGTLVIANDRMQQAMRTALSQDATDPAVSTRHGKSTLDEVEAGVVVVDQEKKSFLCKVDETGDAIHVYGEMERSQYFDGVPMPIAGESKPALLFEQSIEVPAGVDHCYLCLVVEPGFPFGYDTATAMEKVQRCSLQFYCEGDTVFYVDKIEHIEVLAKITRDENGILSCAQIYDGGDIDRSTTPECESRYYSKEYLIPEFRLIADPNNIVLKYKENVDIDMLDFEKIDLANLNGFYAAKLKYGDKLYDNNDTIYTNKIILTNSSRYVNLYSFVDDAAWNQIANIRITQLAYITAQAKHGINFVCEELSIHEDKILTAGICTMGNISIDTYTDEYRPGVIFQKPSSISVYEQRFNLYNTSPIKCETLSIPVTAEKADGKRHQIYATIKHEDGTCSAEYQEDFTPAQYPGTYSFVVCEYQIRLDNRDGGNPRVSVKFHDENIDKFDLRGLWLC